MKWNKLLKSFATKERKSYTVFKFVSASNIKKSCFHLSLSLSPLLPPSFFSHTQSLIFFLSAKQFEIKLLLFFYQGLNVHIGFSFLLHLMHLSLPPPLSLSPPSLSSFTVVPIFACQMCVWPLPPTSSLPRLSLLPFCYHLGMCEVFWSARDSKGLRNEWKELNEVHVGVLGSFKINS